MKGKFDSERDAVIHQMTLDGWANDSDGDVQSSEGYFSRVSVSVAELAEVMDAFPHATDSIVGNFLMVEDSQGFVTVTEYPTESAVESAFRRLFVSFHSDIDY